MGHPRWTAGHPKDGSHGLGRRPLPDRLFHKDMPKDAELLVLRHESAVLRGYHRIHDELTKPGMTVASSTVRRPCMPRASIQAPRGPDVAAVFHAQADGVVAVDYLHVDTVRLKRLHVVVFIEHGTCRMHLGGVTANPTGEWTVRRPATSPRASASCSRTLHSWSATGDRTSPPRLTPSSRPLAPGSCAPRFRLAHERNLRMPHRDPAPPAPRPGADPRRGTLARRPD